MHNPSFSTKPLSRLKYYCEMCRKQLRDANGYKCHLSTERHLENMQKFAENPSFYIDLYSTQLVASFSKICKRFAGKRTNINAIYQEYIVDRDHAHLSSTKFASLHALAVELSNQGLCKLDESELPHVYITWIDTSPEFLAMTKALEKKKDRAELSAEDLEMNLLKKQMRKANAERVVKPESVKVCGKCCLIFYRLVKSFR